MYLQKMEAFGWILNNTKRTSNFLVFVNIEMIIIFATWIEL